jgi:hypothetical protein|tara:strand:+ start:114 stop:284 length:171 start_codon:yes stop_codon:yes gene_type:complete
MNELEDEMVLAQLEGIHELLEALIEVAHCCCSCTCCAEEKDCSDEEHDCCCDTEEE